MSIESQRHRIEISLDIANPVVIRDTQTIMGIIDQIIVESTTDGQSVDLLLFNDREEEIYAQRGLTLDTVRNDLRPRIFPRGIVSIQLQNFINMTGSIFVTIIEQEKF